MQEGKVGKARQVGKASQAGKTAGRQIYIYIYWMDV